jgi:hypothetical protein
MSTDHMAAPIYTYSLDQVPHNVGSWPAVEVPLNAYSRAALIAGSVRFAMRP